MTAERCMVDRPPLYSLIKSTRTLMTASLPRNDLTYLFTYMTKLKLDKEFGGRVLLWGWNCKGYQIRFITYMLLHALPHTLSHTLLHALLHTLLQTPMPRLLISRCVSRCGSERTNLRFRKLLNLQPDVIRISDVGCDSPTGLKKTIIGKLNA